MVTRKKLPLLAPLMVCAVFAMAGCSASDDEGSVADSEGNSGAAAVPGLTAPPSPKAAYEALSEELRTAAVGPGEGICDLPRPADAVAARRIDARTQTYNTMATPEEVYGFYRVAAEHRDRSISIDGQHGMYTLRIGQNGTDECSISTGAQPTGDTNIIVTTNF